MPRPARWYENPVVWREIPQADIAWPVGKSEPDTGDYVRFQKDRVNGAYGNAPLCEMRAERTTSAQVRAATIVSRMGRSVSRLRHAATVSWLKRAAQATCARPSEHPKLPTFAQAPRAHISSKNTRSAEDGSRRP